MITIRVKSEDTLCGECGQPSRECKCFAAGRPRQLNRLQKLEDELQQLATRYPEVLGDRFTSNATGERRQVLMSVRRYFAVLGELAEIRMCACSGATSGDKHCLLMSWRH